MYNTQSREWRTWDRGRCCIKVLGSLTQYIILALIEGGDEHLVFSFSSVQSLSDVWFFETSWTTACQASLSITNSMSLLELMSIESVMPSNHLSSSSSPAFSLSQHQGVFKWVSSSHQVAKVLKFQLQHQSFQWLFRTDFL